MNARTGIWLHVSLALACAASCRQAHAQDRPHITLRVRALPPPGVASLAMRPADRPSDRIALVASDAGDDADRAASAGPDSNAEQDSSADDRTAATSGSFARSLSERVIFRFNLGHQLASSSTSGRAGLSGLAPGAIETPDGASFAGVRQYAFGDLVLGTDGWLLPSMTTYFASRMHYSIDGASAFSALTTPYDREDGRALMVRAGYAEIAGFGRADGPLAGLFVRAGRQFRYGNTRFISHFDGLSLAYERDAFDVSAFVGQRVLLYASEHRGLTAGAGLRLVGRELVGVPVDVAVDYLFIAGYGDPEDADAPRGVDRHYAEMLARAPVGPGEIEASARLVDGVNPGAEGLGLGRVGVGYRHKLGARLRLGAEVEHIFARDTVYDLVAPASTDIVQVASQLGLAISPLGDATRASARVDVSLSRHLELYGFATVHLAHGESQSGYDTSYQEFGLASHARLYQSIALSLQYKLRNHLLDDDTEPLSSFADTSGAGISRAQELSLEARARVLGGRLTVALGGLASVDDFASPYTVVQGEMRTGARLALRGRIHERVHLDVTGEVAEAAPVMSADLGVLTSVRAVLEATF